MVVGPLVERSPVARVLGQQVIDLSDDSLREAMWLVEVAHAALAPTLTQQGLSTPV
jgi:hypothetical protein